MIQLSDFNYFLPKELIAHTPQPNRGQSKLLVCNKKTSDISHRIFSDLLSVLSSNDVLVFNNTKVINARIQTTRKSGAPLEFFLVRLVKENEWYALIKPAKKIKTGEIIEIAADFHIEILEKHAKDTLHLIKLHSSQSSDALLDRYGTVPLPPYIQTDSPNAFKTDYQTVFATTPGAVAAPTAGLHFTKELLGDLKQKGVQLETVTLHVGYGTFSPITTETIENHKMHEETIHISPETAHNLMVARQKKKRIIAVGTTVVRALESAYSNGIINSGSSATDIFIYPGYRVKCIDALITNFHLPKSSLLLLVSAFSSPEFIKKAYQEAIEHKYRFFSFGDAMFLH
jgi:S-adenosylmethionine:tRNA ribosyltransferase-isomerase